jgi:hypothetical protein
LSHQKKRKGKKKKKESGDSFVNVYLRLRLTCLLLSTAVAGGFIDCRSQE